MDVIKEAKSHHFTVYCYLAANRRNTQKILVNKAIKFKLDTNKARRDTFSYFTDPWKMVYLVKANYG